MSNAKTTQIGHAVRERRCPKCGAPLAAGQTVCWLCFSPAEPAADQSISAQSRPAAANVRRTPVEAGGGFSLASLMMFMTLVSVVLGVFTIAPGLGMPLGIVAFVTWLRTVSVVKWRASTGSAMTSSQIILLFVQSVAFTLLILVLVGVAAAAAFATVCFGVMSAAEPGSSELNGWLVFAVVVLIAAIFGLVAAARSERRRWRRDHHGPK